MSAPFDNVYYKRAVGTARACYICNKPTTTVLSTQPVVDFIYTCDTHLSDPGFATLQAPAVLPTPSASAEEIAKIKAEWEAKQKKKQEAEKEKKDGEDKKDGEMKDREKDKVASPKTVSPAPVASGSATPKHDKYVLHRQLYTMRLTDHRRRRQQKEVDVLAPKLSGPGLSVPKQVG
ncbi:VPS4-associated protein 1 [Rhizoctonia solani]|nr:VPS4-associated protein 1 [Rhizoctonia solani]